MRKTIYLVILFLFSILPVYSQVELLDSPVYLAAMLVDETNIDNMAQKCRAYKYTEQLEEEGFMVFCSPNGEKIRFKVDNNTNIVEIFTQKKSSSIKEALTNAGFKKSKEGYERRSNFLSRKTTCTLSPEKLCFTKEPKVLQRHIAISE